MFATRVKFLIPVPGFVAATYVVAGNVVLGSNYVTHLHILPYVGVTNRRSQKI